MDYLDQEKWENDNKSGIKNIIISYIIASLSTSVSAAFTAADLFAGFDDNDVIVDVGNLEMLERELGSLFGSVIYACNKGIISKENIFSYADIERKRIEEEIRERIDRESDEDEQF